MTKPPSKQGKQAVVAPATPSLVVRSTVPVGLPYTEYRQYLRRDFFYSCAYCTICESEATTIAFTIDHYEPQSMQGANVDAYPNLMYSCNTCNLYKSDLTPPPNARAAGVRHFRPDQDARSDHFELKGLRLKSKTDVGEFSIETIDLNRLKLRKLRDLRRRLTECEALVAEGVRALRKFRMDELPPKVRGGASSAITTAANTADKISDEIDDLLSDYARSPMADADPEEEARAKARAISVRTWQALYPGVWRGRTLKRAAQQAKGPRAKAGKSRRKK